MEANVKTIIFLFVFVLIGIVLFQPIYSEITYITTPGTYTTVGTTSSFVPNPAYVGSNNAPLVSLVPVFYLIVLIVVPAVVAYKIYRGD